MTRSTQLNWTLRIAVIALALLVLRVWQPSNAAQREALRTAPNPTVQRAQIITELKAINSLLQQQAALLQSGKIKVVVMDKDSSN